MSRDAHSRYSITFETHDWYKNAMNYILGPQDQLHFASDRQDQRGRYKIVPAGGIRGIEAQWVSFFGLGKLLGIGVAQLSIATGVAKVPLKLSTGHFNLQRGRFVNSGDCGP